MGDKPAKAARKPKKQIRFLIILRRKASGRHVANFSLEATSKAESLKFARNILKDLKADSVNKDLLPGLFGRAKKS